MAQRLDGLDRRIAAIREEDQFLIDLLTTDGNKLKLAVKQTLELLIQHTSLNVPVLDVDGDPALRGGSTQNREDLRIEYDDNAVLINVGGREQFLRPTSLNQISRHHRLFNQASGNGKKVHSLLIANYNYGKGLDPRKRGEMFDKGTVEAQERLQSEGHGAVSTFDLFRLIRAVQAKEVVLTPELLAGLLSTVGILDYESLHAKLSLKT